MESYALLLAATLNAGTVLALASVILITMAGTIFLLPEMQCQINYTSIKRIFNLKILLKLQAFQAMAHGAPAYVWLM